MKRLLLVSVAACALVAIPTLSASAMPRSTADTLIDSSDSPIILAHGGHGHGHRGGRPPLWLGQRSSSPSALIDNQAALLEAASVGGLLHGYIREVSAHTLRMSNKIISAPRLRLFSRNDTGQ